MARVLIPWSTRDGFGLIVKASSEELTVHGRNASITLAARRVTVNDGVRESVIRDVGKRRYVYLYLSEPLEPLPIGLGETRALVGRFEVSVVIIDEDMKYVTIVAPGGWLYNYAILTSDILSIESSVKRKVYTERLDGEFNVYFA